VQYEVSCGCNEVVNELQFIIMRLSAVIAAVMINQRGA
jgi:hypothetical protein